MKASDWIIDFFARRGVDTLYGYIGGMVTHLIDSASRDARVRFVQTYHEQSAAFAAEGYARRPGSCRGCDRHQWTGCDQSSDGGCQCLFRLHSGHLCDRPR